MHFATALQSSTGGRDKNQDDADHFAQDGLEGWILADGLGGHRGGGLASSLATEAMRDTCCDRGDPSGDTIAAAAQAAQDRIHERQQQAPKYGRMRTTFVLLLADPEAGRARWGHAGDSRLYHFRDGAIANRTKDHSVVQALVDAGELDPEDQRDHDASHRILRALGDADAANPDVTDDPVSVRPGDAFLLCSDGFWEGVVEDTMLKHLATADTPDDWLDDMVAHIEQGADEEQDNFTAVAVFVAGA
jgi:serine/threonine protein phosphatase PrpC